VAENDAQDDPTQSFTALTVGTAVAHYRIISRIGAGGMGEVYLAEDTELNRKVALKFLPFHMSASQECRTRFKREAQAAAALDHENIATVYEVSEFSGRPFFSMQYVEGRSLREVIKARPLSLEEAVSLSVQICEGLSEAHRCGITHRDIKPSNVVVDSHGRPRLVDFGLAIVKGAQRITKTGTALGTVGYLAPEIVRGEPADTRSDIFSVGVLLYELVTGCQPFLKDSEAATLHAIAYDSPEPVALLREGVPEELQRIVDRALDKNRDTRYGSIDDLLNDLRVLHYAVVGGERLPVARPLRHRRARSNARLVGSFTVAVLVVLALFLVPGSRQTIREWFGAGRVPNERHLAVLPFADLGGGDLGQIFCDGLIETLSSKLTQLEHFHGSLLVVPASEVRQRGVASAGQARAAFGVNLAVSGSIQQLGQAVRVTLNLIDAESERQLRASVVDHVLTDLTALQDSTVVIVANMLEVQLRPEEERVLQAGRTNSPGAYDLYVRGQGYLQHAEKLANVDTAIEFFQQALDRDPDYVLALAGLGEAYWRKYSVETDPRYEELAVYSSRRALALDDQIAPVYVTLGLIYTGTGRYQEAADVFNQALSLDSTSRAAFAGLAEALESMGRLDAAEEVYRKAIAVRPDHWPGYTNLGLFYVTYGRYDEALEQLDRAVALGQDGYVVWNDLGGLYFAVGEIDRAQEMWERSVRIEPNYGALSNLGILHFMNDRFALAAQKYEMALELNNRDYRIWLNLASVLKRVPGEDTRSGEAYSRGIELAEVQRQINPSDPGLLAQLADAYASIGDDDRAISRIDEALELDPNNVETMVTGGCVFEQIGHRDRALSLIANALKCGFPRNQIEPLPELRELMKDPRLDRMMDEGRAPGSDSI